MRGRERPKQIAALTRKRDRPLLRCCPWRPLLGVGLGGKRVWLVLVLMLVLVLVLLLVLVALEGGQSDGLALGLALALALAHWVWVRWQL